MGIFQRTGDMISATVGDLLDRFENPVKMLRHALRNRRFRSRRFRRGCPINRGRAAIGSRTTGAACPSERVDRGRAKGGRAGNDDLARRALPRSWITMLACNGSMLSYPKAAPRMSGCGEKSERCDSAEKRAPATRRARGSPSRDRRSPRAGKAGSAAGSAGFARSIRSLSRKDRVAEAEAIAAAELDESGLETTDFDIDNRQHLIDAELLAMQCEIRAAPTA